MTFELLTPAPAKLASVNVRAELHGKETVPAVDLKITFDGSNDILTTFDPWLRSALYFKAEVGQAAEGQQGTLDGVQDEAHALYLRMINERLVDAADADREERSAV